MKAKAVSLKDILCSWIERINIAKMTILSNATYRLKVVRVKMTIAFFTELEQIILKFVFKFQ